LQTVRHHFNIYTNSYVSLAKCCEMSTANSLHASQTRYTLQRNTASIMKGLVWFRVVNEPIVWAWFIYKFFRH